MCELMGLSFARPISADFSIREFAIAGEENADGWGLAWYPDRSVALVKEPREWRTSKHTSFLETYPNLLSPIYIAHVRHKTVGVLPTHADTHPFTRELAGRDYAFCHNGTVTDLNEEFPLGRFRPIGQTDSEYTFCHLLHEIEQRGGELSDGLADPAIWPWLHQKLTAINAHGKLNCLFSDGARLFCYHDRAAYKGLCLRKIHVRSQEIRRFEDETVQIDLEGESINHGYVMATRPLSRSGWEKLAPGELLVFEKGAIRHSSNAERLANTPRQR